MESELVCYILLLDMQRLTCKISHCRKRPRPRAGHRSESLPETPSLSSRGMGYIHLRQNDHAHLLLFSKGVMVRRFILISGLNCQ